MIATIKSMKELGTVKFNTVEICEDYLSISVKLEDINPQILKQLMEAVDIEKQSYQEEVLSMSGRTWSEEGITIDTLWLDIDLHKKDIAYRINAFFSDKADSQIETSACVEVDLSSEEKRLKKMILRNLIDKFF